MTDKVPVNISRERIEKLKSMDCADYIHMAMLDRIEALEVERDEALFLLSNMTNAVRMLERHGDKVMAERDNLREALEPFKTLAKHHAADAPEWGPFDSVTAIVSIRNLRDAAAALETET